MKKIKLKEFERNKLEEQKLQEQQDQERSEKLKQMETYLKTHQLPVPIQKLHKSNQYRFIQRCNRYQIKDGKMVNKETGYPVLTPENRVSAVMEEFKRVPMGAKAIIERMKGSGLTHRQIRETLHQLVPDQLHRPLPPPRLIKHITAQEYGEKFQADLVDMTKYKWHNQGYGWILTVIDIYSRKAWAFKLKNKSTQEVLQTLRPLLISEKVKILHTDNGSEFTSNEFQSMCHQLQVKQIFGPPYSPHSQGHIERFNRTLKSMLFKYFTWNQTKIWIDILEKFVDQYNHTTHSSTLMKPITQEAKRAFRPIKQPPIPQKYPVGATVRVALRNDPQYRKKIFEKKYTVQWTRDTYQIVNNKGDMYRIQNLAEPEEKRKWVSHNDLQVISGEVEIKPNPRTGREAHLEKLREAKPQYQLPQETLLESRSRNPRIRKPVERFGYS
jgi:transposase InsO family protein